MGVANPQRRDRRSPKSSIARPRDCLLVPTSSGRICRLQRSCRSDAVCTSRGQSERRPRHSHVGARAKSFGVLSPGGTATSGTSRAVGIAWKRAQPGSLAALLISEQSSHLADGDGPADDNRSRTKGATRTSWAANTRASSMKAALAAGDPRHRVFATCETLASAVPSQSDRGLSRAAALRLDDSRRPALL